MNVRTQLIVTAALIALVAIGLVVALTQCEGQPTPATGVPPTTQPAPTTTALADQTTEPIMPTTTPGPSPTPTLRPEVELARELIKPGGQVTYSADGCGEILEDEPWCSVIKSAKPITCTEWEELFPQTDFFVVKRIVYGGEFPQQRNLLIVEQDGKRYRAKSFDHLLRANGVLTITDENRELVAKAFALMTIPDYLEEEVVFTEWEQGDWTSNLTPNYNYKLTAWTKIQGLRIEWLFVFYNNSLLGAEGYVLEHNVGDYIDVPFEVLSQPSPESLSYWRR